MRSTAMWLAAAALGLLTLSSPAPAQTPPPAATPAPAPIFSFQEVMIPMRDGVKLQTVILAPLDAKGPLPILMQRTPYGVPDKAFTRVPINLRDLAADGYILVFQNIRGRFKSEGSFTLSEDSTVTPGKGTIETRDAYDTID